MGSGASMQSVDRARQDIASEAVGRPGEPPQDRLIAVAAGLEVEAEVHEGVLKEPPVLDIDRFNLW